MLARNLVSGHSLQSGRGRATSQQRSPVAALRLFRGELTVGGRISELSPGEVPLFVALARAQRVLSCRELAFQLFLELEETRARNRIYVYLHRLRKRYGAGIVVADGAGYGLHPALFVDVWECERVMLRTSLAREARLTATERALLEGAVESHALPEALPDSFALYITSARRRIRIAYARDCALRGDGTGVLRVARSMLVDDPCDEIGSELAIRAHLYAGNRLGALAQWSEYRAHLRLEIAADPSPALRAVLDLDRAEGRAILLP